MTTTDLPLIVFAVCNALRIAAHFPQMFNFVRHPAAAAAFSYATWAMFAAADLSAAIHAGAGLCDPVPGMVNAFSAMCCGTLIGPAAWRCRYPSMARASALKLGRRR